MSTEENKALVRRFYDEVTNGRNVAALDELLAPNFEGFAVEGSDQRPKSRGIQTHDKHDAECLPRSPSDHSRLGCRK